MLVNCQIRAADAPLVPDAGGPFLREPFDQVVCAPNVVPPPGGGYADIYVDPYA